MESVQKLPVFVGVCESCLVRGQGVQQDFYGVGDMLLLPFFPQCLKGVYLLFALHRETIGRPTRFTIIDKTHSDSTGSCDLTSFTKAATGQVSVLGYARHYPTIPSKEDDAEKQGASWLLTSADFEHKLLPIPCPPIWVTEPTTVEVIAEVEKARFRLGSFHCEFVPTHPISDEERMAIMSRPGASKVITLHIGCKTCNDRRGFYLPLDPEGEVSHESEGVEPLRNAPDKWTCKCGKAVVPLIYAKKGLHQVFRGSTICKERGNLEFKALYQKGALAAILSEYQRLLREHKESEEQVQKFLAANQILWNFLAPVKIWVKPPILNKFKADFAVLNGRNVLHFIEIEKPATKMLKRRGGVHSQLQAAIDQIRDWKTEVQKRREAVLDGLQLSQSEVHDVKYVIIAGMAANTAAKGLEKIRSMRTDADSILCFDELASFLHSTETAMLNI